MNAITKSQLIQRIALQFHDLPTHVTEECVQILLSTMFDAIASGQRIEIRGFGAFSYRIRPPRCGRNPKTGDKVTVPAKMVAHFAPGKEMKERIIARANLAL